MLFPQHLEQGFFVRRYKRFFADIQLENGEILTAHCPNTGSMKNCLAEGAPAWFSRSTDPKRKLSATWEIATTPAGHLAGINTGRANKLVQEALMAGLLPELKSHDSLRTEVLYGDESSRADFLLTIQDQSVYVEVKSVTLAEDDGNGYFPDAVSQRGARHLRELIQMVRNGHRAVLLYCVQHTGIRSVAPAAHIDSIYADTFYAAVAAGVQVYALGARITPQEITLDRTLPVILG